MVDKHSRMKTFIFLLTLVFLPQMILAQFSQGKIIYERTSYWARIAQRLPYLSQEENMLLSRTAVVTTYNPRWSATKIF